MRARNAGFGGGAGGRWVGATGAVPAAAAAAWGSFARANDAEPAFAGVPDAVDSARPSVRLGGGAPAERDREPHGAD